MIPLSSFFYLFDFFSLIGRIAASFAVNLPYCCSGYAEFAARIRENEKAIPRDQAITEAVQSCVKDGILADFLKEHGAEVVIMP
jgi:hypothetical protein